MVHPDGPVVVRLARDDDDLDAINAHNPRWFSATFLRNAFAAVPPEIPTAIWIGEIDGRAGGYAHAVAAGIRDGHRARADVFVDPDYRRRGVGLALWQEVLALCTPDLVAGIMLEADADDPTSAQIALTHGFARGGLHRESALDLTVPVTPAPPPQGIVLTPIPDDEASWQTLWVTTNELGAQAPDSAEGAADMPYDVFRAMVREPWHSMCAWDGGRLVGMTVVAVRDEQGRSLNTILTAVNAAYRGRGLSTTLKSAHAQALAARGWRSVVTQNMEGNAPILAANARLGFQVTGGCLDLTYDFS